MTVVRPKTLDEAVRALAELDATVVAGGTDVMVEAYSGKHELKDVVAVRRLPELLDFEVNDSAIRVGAAVSYATLTGPSGMPRDAAPVLYSAAAAMGSTQIRAMGTVGGNVGTASPVGDALCALLALDAQATVASRAGLRINPVSELIASGGGSALGRGDLLVNLSWSAAAGPQRFLKVCRRGAVSRSVVSVSVVTDAEGLVRIAIGGCGPRPLRATAAEQLAAAGANLTAVADAAMAAISPLSDVAASADYRRHVAGVLVRRALSPRGDESRSETRAA